ncbi:hypothetical protein IQ218_13130 [Synechocystis salina LEGE 06099]|uniref:hypothetical protein n=1 Tax=Synechocystis salina TaxID=945780 RepID=UPI001882AAA7|nr:hypothetical protein [Synechocystis salina]MBE9204207.1 hypothetical protein [Synechocystis salina LEGE 06099]
MHKLPTCDGLHTLPSYLGAERESLPLECNPSLALAFPMSDTYPTAVTTIPKPTKYRGCGDGQYRFSPGSANPD